MRIRPGNARLWWEMALHHNDPDSGLPVTEFDSFLASCDVKPDPTYVPEENDPNFDPCLDSESESEFNASLAAMPADVRALAMSPGELPPDLLAAISRGDHLPPDQRAVYQARQQ